MKRPCELAVTLDPELYTRLAAEAAALDVPLEWVVASLVLDTIESDSPEPALV